MAHPPGTPRLLCVTLGFAALVGVLPASRPASAWIHQNHGSASLGGSARDVAVDGAGDVVAAGEVSTAPGQQDLAVIKLDGATGGQIWRTEISGTGSGFDRAESVGVDAAGDVFAGGRLYNSATGSDFTVVKLDGATGAELWRSEIDGAYAGVHDEDGANALVVDGDGDVVVAGLLYDASASDFFVVQLDGASGAEVWRRSIDGGLSGGDQARDLALDAAGDVVAAGHFWEFGGGFAVVKLDGADGSELWRQAIGPPGTAVSGETALAVVFDGEGDVVAAGQRRIAGSGYHFSVFKFAGETGAELWRQEIDDPLSGEGSANAVTVDASGDVFAAGKLLESATNFDLTVFKFDGDTGAEEWRRGFDGTVIASFVETDEATAIVADGSGDVVALGYVHNHPTNLDAVAIKLDGGTGATLWRQESPALDGHDRAHAAVVSGAGNLVVATDVGGTAAVLELDGERGTFRSLAGQAIVAKDPGDPAKRSLRTVLQSDLVESPWPDSFADPRTAGGTVRIVNPTTLEEATFSLPAGPEWSGLGNPPGSTGYTYRAVTSPGPCTFAQVRLGKRIQIRCSGKTGLFPFTLDEASQGSLAVSLGFGVASPQCAVFGGIVQSDEPGSFKRKKAPAQPACP